MLGRPRNSIHIKNLPASVTSNDLWTEFKKYGEIVNVTIPVDVTTSQTKGYAFVEYADPLDATKTVHAMNGVRLWGRALTVEYSRSYPKTSREMALRSVLNPPRPIVLPNNVPVPPTSTRQSSLTSSTRSGSRTSSRSYSHRATRRHRCYSSDSSHYSSSSCSVCSNYLDKRHRRSTGSYRSYSNSVTSRSTRRRASPSPKRKTSRGFSRSEGEVTDYDENDGFDRDTSFDDLPDSVVIAANLMSSASSGSLYSVSSRSSCGSSRISSRRRRYPSDSSHRSSSRSSTS